MVVERRAVAYLGVYGLARVGAAHAAGIDERFIIGTPWAVGSLSRTVTALALLVLDEQGYLDLDDTLGTQLLDAPALWRNRP